MSKKSIIALITVIVLLFAAGVSVGVFLYTRGTSEATDGNRTIGPNDGNNGGTEIVPDNGNTEPTQPDNGNVVVPTENDNTTTANNNANANTNNENTANNAGNTGNANNAGNTNNAGNAAGNTGVTTDTGVNNVGETTIERVEEREKLVSRAYWDWWKPMTVALTKSNVGVNQPQLSVKKTVITEVAGNKFVYAGQEMTYVIAVTNNSDEDVKDIEITDKIPEKTTFVSIEDATVDGEGVGTKTTVVSENTVLGVKWEITVPAGKTVIARFTVQVNKEMLVETDNGEIAEVPTTGTISNVAIANGEESKDPTNKPDEGGETKVSIITAKKSSKIIRLERQIQENEKEAAELGDLIEYTITVENTGDIEGTTYIQDNVPAGTEFVSAEGDAIISEEKDTVAWSITLGANETITRKFVVRVIDAENTIKNTASVGGNSTNEDKIETIDYVITKTAKLNKNQLNNLEKYAEKAEVGDVIEYTITVTNTGSKTLEDINVIDNMLDLDAKITLESKASNTYTITYTVTSEDINNAREFDGKIFNYAIAIYNQREEYDDASINTRTDYDYTIYHVEKDNPENVLGTDTGNAELATEVPVTKKEFTGYEYDSKSSDTIIVDTENNVAYVYYTRNSYDYTIYHVEKDNPENVLDTDTGTAEFEKNVDVEQKDISGYEYDSKSSDTIIIDTENNIAYVYYTRKLYDYTIYHVEKDNPESILDTDTGTAEFEKNVDVEQKDISGYEYDSKSVDTIVINTENNVAYVYYKKLYEYTVEYYFNGVKNDSYTISSKTPANTFISFDTPETLDGYTYISYLGFDGLVNGSKITTTETNRIRVDYGKAVTTIQKSGTEKVNAGEEIEYTITVKNTGYLPATVTVSDELKGTTYVVNSANIEPTITGTTNQTLTWNNVQVSAATDTVREQTTTITFRVKTANDSFGSVIENTANIVGGASSNKVITTINEITAKYREYIEGQKGTDLNIIFVLDNSSSMNEPIEGDANKYLNNKAKYVAPIDEPKTRIYNAKKAVNEFIDEQNSQTTMSIIAFNENVDEQKTTEEMRTLVKNEDIKTKYEKRYVIYGGKEYEVSNEKVKATDGNKYYYIKPETNYGPTLVGTNTGINAVSNSELKAKVDNISISSAREGFGTFVGTAFDFINNNVDTYISKDKKNIVIVLADGKFNGEYSDSLSTLKGNVDGIYCIGFGSGKDYDEISLKNMSTNNTCYKASNASTLLEKFQEIKEEASGTEKTGTTEQGIITLTATGEIKVSTECPIIVTYNTGSVDASGNPVMAELFKCTSTADLARYGLTITNKNTLTWDAKVYVRNTGSTVPSTVYLKYYIPRSNG